jgi:ABC-2 type transport system permease protein
MRADQVATIFRREYLTRVRSKGFWIATLLLPLAMATLVVVPLLISLTTKSEHRLTVVDAVGGLGDELARRLSRAETPAPKKLGEPENDSEAETANIQVTVVAAATDPGAQRAELDRRVLAGEIDAWIWLGRENLEANSVEYHAESVANFMTQRRLERELMGVFSASKLAAAGYDAAKVVELTRPVKLETLKVTAEGTKAEAGMTGFFLAYFLFFLLYTVVAIYGSLVMNGVLEEKSSRIVEVLLATTTPKELLIGKLVGISLAGLTQLGVWAVALAVFSAPSVVGALASGLADKIPAVPLVVLVHFLAHFLLGFFLYASFYAAIGAATNSVQEAQPFTGVILPFLIAPMLFMMPVINDPDSTLATVLSLIPPFTPLLMLLRIAVKTPPAWQIALGYLLTSAFVWGMVALCARIYRVGILMYGKRPTFRELGRWIRQA